MNVTIQASSLTRSDITDAYNLLIHTLTAGHTLRCSAWTLERTSLERGKVQGHEWTEITYKATKEDSDTVVHFAETDSFFYWWMGDRAVLIDDDGKMRAERSFEDAELYASENDGWTAHRI